MSALRCISGSFLLFFLGWPGPVGSRKLKHFMHQLGECFRGVRRTALKKAYRRRCPGLRWPGTPGVNKPQIRPGARHAHATSSSGLTHHQQLQHVLGNRILPSKSAPRMLLSMPIEQCSEPTEVDAAPWMAVSLPGSRTDSSSIHPHLVLDDARDMSTDGHVLADADDCTDPEASEIPGKVLPETGSSVLYSSSIEHCGEPLELPWGGPGSKPTLRTPPSTILQMIGLKANLPAKRLLKGSGQAAGRMTMTTDGPVDRSLPIPYLRTNQNGQNAVVLPSCAAPRLPRNIEVTVNLLMQTVGRRELHRHCNDISESEDMLSTAVGHPMLPKIVSKKEMIFTASSSDAPPTAADGTNDTIHSRTWEQLSVWCLTLVADIELVLWIDTASGGAGNQRMLYRPNAMKQRDAQEFIQVVESTSAWSETDWSASLGRVQAKSVSVKEHAAAVAKVATTNLTNGEQVHKQAETATPDYELKLFGAPWLDYAGTTIGTVMAAHKKLPAAHIPAPPYRSKA